MRRRQRFYKIKRRKRKSILKNKFFWLFFLIFAFLGGIFYFISFSPFFQVAGSEISGNEKVPPQALEEILQKEIEKKFLFFPTKSIFFANLEEIKEKILKEFPQIAEIELKRNFPDKISIRIKEKKPKIIFCQKDEENCFLLDEKGIIIERISKKDASKLPTVRDEKKSLTLGAKVMEEKDLLSLLEIQEKLRKNQKIEITEFLPSPGKLIAQTSEGWQIFFDLKGDISEQILNLEILLKEKIPPQERPTLEYIDLRFGNKIYFKKR